MKQKIKSNKPKSRMVHSARLLTVPHKHNQYRPHVIRWQGLTLVIMLAVSIFAIQNFSEHGSVLGKKTDITRAQLLASTNQTRLASKAHALSLNAELNQAAEAKAANMFNEQYWAHVSPSGNTPWKWIDESGYAYAYAGENLAKGFVSADGVVTAWMHSPEHRANLLKPEYQHAGFAVKKGTLHGKETTLVVALYGEPKEDNSSVASVLAANGAGISPITRLGVAVQSLTPAMVGSLTLLVFVSAVAFVTHQYRHMLPKNLRQGWRRHHGLYKSLGMATFAIVLVALYGGGQI